MRFRLCIGVENGCGDVASAIKSSRELLGSTQESLA